jgi:hypothetical protein
MHSSIGCGRILDLYQLALNDVAEFAKLTVMKVDHRLRIGGFIQC